MKQNAPMPRKNQRKTSAQSFRNNRQSDIEYNEYYQGFRSGIKHKTLSKDVTWNTQKKSKESLRPSEETQKKVQCGDWQSLMITLKSVIM